MGRQRQQEQLEQGYRRLGILLGREPILSFSLEGMQIYADNMCPFEKFKWRTHCPRLAQTMVRQY